MIATVTIAVLARSAAGHMLTATEAVRDVCCKSSCYERAPAETIQVIAQLSLLNHGRRNYTGDRPEWNQKWVYRYGDLHESQITTLAA